MKSIVKLRGDGAAVVCHRHGWKLVPYQESRARALRFGGYLISLVLLIGCNVSAESSEDSSDLAASPDTPEPEAQAIEITQVSEAHQSPEEAALRQESNRLTLERRSEFHMALADRLELSDDTKGQFLRLLAETEAERLTALADSDESSGAARQVARASALRQLLGPEKTAQYFELRETRRTWYRASGRGRVAMPVTPIQSAERGAL